MGKADEGVAEGHEIPLPETVFPSATGGIDLAIAPEQFRLVTGEMDLVVALIADAFDLIRKAAVLSEPLLLNGSPIKLTRSRSLDREARAAKRWVEGKTMDRDGESYRERCDQLDADGIAIRRRFFEQLPGVVAAERAALLELAKRQDQRVSAVVRPVTLKRKTPRRVDVQSPRRRPGTKPGRTKVVAKKRNAPPPKKAKKKPPMVVKRGRRGGPVGRAAPARGRRQRAARIAVARSCAPPCALLSRCARVRRC